MLRIGGHATVESPAGLAEEVQRTAVRALAAYEPSTRTIDSDRHE
jgi:hypothetical protein